MYNTIHVAVKIATNSHDILWGWFIELCFEHNWDLLLALFCGKTEGAEQDIAIIPLLLEDYIL